MTRSEIINLLEDERQLIISRYCETQGVSPPLPSSHHLPWYLNISKDWAIHHLDEILCRPPGVLVDVGAMYGLIPGVAASRGWRIVALDSVEIPAYSSLRVPGREVEFGICNACTDPLPCEPASVDVVLLSEVLEHLVYSPMPLFREIARVLKPDGVLLLSTPNPAALSRLLKLAMGRNPLEPTVDLMLEENCTYQHKGLTFFANNRESKLWAYGEIAELLRRTGLETVRHLYYGNTVRFETDTLKLKIRKRLIRLLSPLLTRSRLGGGGQFLVIRRAAAASQT